MAKKYIVDLTAEERSELLEMVNKGQSSARKIKRAHILLLAAEDKPDEQIAEVLHCSVSTVVCTRHKFVAGNLDLAVHDRPRCGRTPKLTNKVEAMITTLAQSTPPQGRTRWTLQLLTERLIALRGIDSLSEESVRQVLKKTN